MALTWPEIQANIFAGESGGDYNALFNYQNRPNGRFSDVNLTSMSVGDVLAFQDPNGPYAGYVKGQVGRVATPVGAYQVVGRTLRDAVNALGIDPSQPFDQATQDRIGRWIYDTQGTGAWGGYRPNSTVSTQGTPTMDGYTDPQMMQPASTDPFEGLSRPQRTMLGFAALQDAAAQLQGQQGGAFQNALAGFESARDRERLRAQGQMQSRVDAMSAAAQLGANISEYTRVGMPVPPELQNMYNQLLNVAGGGQLGGPQVTPASATTPAAPAPETTAAPAEAAPAETAPTSGFGSIPRANATMEEFDSYIYNEGNDLDSRIRVAQRAAAQFESIPTNAAYYNNLVAELQAQKAAQTTGAETEARGQRIADMGQVIANSIISGFDAEGNPVFNPMFDTRLGAWTSEALGSGEYKQLEGAIEELKNVLTFDNLQRLKANGGLSGTITDNDLRAIAALSGSIDINNPRGTYATLKRLSDEYGIEIAGLSPQQTAPTAAAPQAGGVTFTKVD